MRGSSRIRRREMMLAKDGHGEGLYMQVQEKGGSRG